MKHLLFSTLLRGTCDNEDRLTKTFLMSGTEPSIMPKNVPRMHQCSTNYFGSFQHYSLQESLDNIRVDFMVVLLGCDKLQVKQSVNREGTLGIVFSTRSYTRRTSFMKR